MLQPEYTNQFRKDLKTIQKQRLDISLLKEVIEMLCMGQKLPQKYKDHILMGNWLNCRECHIKPNWLLIYHVSDGMIVFERTGSHSDLF